MYFVPLLNPSSRLGFFTSSTKKDLEEAQNTFSSSISKRATTMGSGLKGTMLFEFLGM